MNYLAKHKYISTMVGNTPIYSYDITKIIDENMVVDYLQLENWEVWDEDENTQYTLEDKKFADKLPRNTISSNPYDYASVSANRLEPIIIGTESFDNYSSFQCVNTKTYQTTPERAMDGSIPDINDIATFIVPRMKIKFDKMSIQDFRRMLKAIEPNEFLVQYYDYEQNKVVKYYMYIEPREMAEIYNVGYEILDILGYEFSFIGTLNDGKTETIKYYTTRNNSPVLLATDSYDYGTKIRIRKGESLTSDYVPENQHFAYWQLNGTQQKYLSNDKIYATSDMDLYAVYE